MSDREPTAPANQPRPGPARTAPPGDPNPTAHPESAPRGDGPPMSLTLVPRTHARTHATDGRTADPIRVWLARLLDAADELPAFVPARVGPGHMSSVEQGSTRSVSSVEQGS